MSQTRVQFIENESGNHAVVVVKTTVRGGIVAHLIDTFSRLRIEVHKVESRLDDDGWLQRLVVAAPGGQRLDREWLDELKAAVFATIEIVNQSADDDDASSGTFVVAPLDATEIQTG